MVGDCDKFFNPNVCHVCKSADNGKFITCDRCRMITYCSESHREENQPSHTEICAAIHKLLSKEPQSSEPRHLNREEWIQSRKEFLRSVKTELPRDLKPFEVQMILFARSCLLCHRQANLQACVTCYNANYCADHEDDLKEQHSSDCKNLQSCYQLDQFRHLNYFEYSNKFSTFPDKNRPVTDMDTFINRYVRTRFFGDKIGDWYCPQYFYSDYVSGPLTLYHGMRDANLFCSKVKDYVVHVIDAKSIDKEYLRAWEIILHVARHVKHLRVILIGTELPTENGPIETCATCYCNHVQKFSFESCRMLYHTYVKSDAYKQPCVIVGFQIDFADGEARSESISALREQNCPVLLTAKSRPKAEQNISKIHEVLGVSLNPLYNDTNTFVSRRPWRDLETDGVFYRNSHLTMYKNLQD